MAESNATQVILTDDGIKIIKAQNTADNAAGGVDNLNDPNLMSVIEKQRLQVQMDNFATIYAADKDIATSEGIDFTAYDAAYHAYLTYMTPLVADMTTYSPIVRATFNSLVTAVQAEQKRFNAATQAQYNQQINKAQTDISDGQTKYKALLSEADTMKSSVAGIADEASKAISNAGFASNMASAASQGANEASQAASRALSSALSAESNASSAVAKAESTASAFGPVKQNADSALSTALNAKTDASSAVDKAESTASAFGLVSQKADSAFANAMSAQNVASSAVTQALSAASDSKDAKQIAGAVSQSYKTLTDGSTMTIAELQNGLAVKLTKKDLDGYATENWAQNQIKTTADGLSGTISSVKNTVDSQTTSINDFQADSKKFKAQFTTVNDTLGKHTTDIGTLQASSKELSSDFDSLSTDNKTNQHNISQLSQTVDGIQANVSKKIEQKDLNGYATETWTDGQIKLTADGINEVLSKKIEQKDLNGYATQDWAQNQIKLTADGINGTLSKKIEKTDLNGYATQDWAQNQIKLTADGINGTLSSIKGTVDSHTTSIHDIQSDSKEFKSQFTTYKDTVDRHDTDISTLQASSEKLSSNFDSLNTVNGTNEHHISELQQTAKDFSSTLETVQTQVQNSAVGTNLVTNSKFSGKILADWTVDTGVTTSFDSSGNLVLAVKAASGNRIYHSNQILDAGTTYAISLYAYVDSSSTSSSVNVEVGPYDNLTSIAVSGTALARYTGLIKPVSGSGLLTIAVGAFNSGEVGDIVHITKIKLEKGSVATDWCPNPLDNATVTALTQVKRTADSAQLLATNNQGDVAKLQVKANGLQTTISDKVSSSQLTELSGQLTSKIKDLASSTDSSFRQTANDINGLVKKGDVVNQFNLDAGGALLSTSGNSTKIVFSSPNIIFDSKNPVQIPNANIPGTLTGKTFEAGTITATTKINGADIEAPIIHSPSGSFKLDGKTGDIVGASIHSSDNSWGIDKDGNINGSTINGSTINSSTINGTTFNAGTQLNSYGNTSYPLTISSDGSIDSTISKTNSGITDILRTRIKNGQLITNFRRMSPFETGKYLAGDTNLGIGQLSLYEGYSTSADANFNTNSLRATGYTILDAGAGLSLHGDNQQITFNGTSDDVTPKGIFITPYGNINPNGTQNTWYVGNGPAMKTAQFGIDAGQNVPISLYRQTLVDEIGARGNRLSMGRLLLHAVDENAQMYLLNDGKPAFVSPTIYDRTYSDGANMFVTSAGRVGRSTSASKYKLAIARSDDTSQADRLMTLNPASWNDKVATEKMAESLSNGEIPVEQEINLKRHYGLIAEDLRDAGLDEFLITGDNGQIEGIEYDRLWTVLIPKIKQLNNRINELERKTL